MERRRGIEYSAAAAADHVELVASAQPPAHPSTPPLVPLLIGATAGLFVVLGALILREYTDEEQDRPPQLPTPNNQSIQLGESSVIGTDIDDYQRVGQSSSTDTRVDQDESIAAHGLR